jgi:similar to stage IV sporulation protein
MNIAYALLGSVTLCVPVEYITEMLNLCMDLGIPYTDFSADDDGVYLTFKLYLMKKLGKEADARGIEYTVKRKRGIPAFFARYKYRVGIFFGILAVAILTFVSRMFLWDITVTGNERLTSSYVLELLAHHGLSVGGYVSDLNTDRIENRLLMSTDEISWISINIRGNTAAVQIREAEREEREEVSVLPANLVASKAGLVEYVRIYEGNVVVSAGKYVEKGDLLVSGLFDSERAGFRYTRASGEVMARTTTEYYVEIPYEYETIRYTGEEKCDKYLNFFGFSINISKNSRKEGAFYDKISIVENCSLYGRDIPVELLTERYLEYERVRLTRTAEEAEELAYFELSSRLAEDADERTVIRKTVVPKVMEDRFVLMCSVVAIENIAQTQEFEIELDTKGN